MICKYIKHDVFLQSGKIPSFPIQTQYADISAIKRGIEIEMSVKIHDFVSKDFMRWIAYIKAYLFSFSVLISILFRTHEDEYREME